MVVQAKEGIKHLTKIDRFARWSFFNVHQLYKSIYFSVTGRLLTRERSGSVVEGLT